MPGNPNSNPFRRLTEEEKKLAEKKAFDLKKAQEEAEEQANKCLNHKEFVRYKEKYERLKQLTIDYLIDYDDPDHMRYAFNVRIAFAKLHQLKLLIHDVQVDNRPRGGKK